MSLFPFFGEARKSVVLIDIDSASVGGAYAHFSRSEPPRVYFTARFPIEARQGTPVAEDMLRTLKTLADTLVSAGASVLMKETGSSHVDSVLVSVGSPWQHTAIEVKTVGDGQKSFTFTKTMMDDALKDIALPEERYSTGALVIATILNGYETARPFGKRAKRADLIVLSSSLEQQTVRAIEATLRNAYHSHSLTFTAFAPLVYTVFRDMYPHEKDFLVLDFSGETTDIAFVKGSLLVDVASIPYGTHRFSSASQPHVGSEVIDLTKNTTLTTRTAEAEREWIALVAETLKQFASRHPLPRTVFLLAGQENREFIKRLFDSPLLHALWLSDEPLRVIPVMPSQFSSFVVTKGSASGDATLALLALFYRKHLGHG